MDDDDAWLAELFDRARDPDRAKQLPAWALLFHSPFDRSGDATSWIGGAPIAPSNFEWPKDRDGTPLHFIAQIDLASLKAARLRITKSSAARRRT
ncbi:DUF1963 domain-containing protein [Bradyrhizobium sp. AUGA SZCCT0431]|uniref:DUF1963 domain-containing protein n=1 Tax=Bradyrhizobium sp. AUGA SZCCT0431 TaxID=2807674 RepID=UPI001BA9D9C4|nr:DUF1963 domain-containing protein [Bradyrhizobium sp. AUGA SZCCT0431]MBR1147809.1 DUF1963 domain-containing protein [Bradyrhizobium sp. AUGA SZCCT0431]